MTEDSTTAPPVPPEDPAEYKPTLPPENKGSGRYAVYDMALERYVGDVQDSKPSSTDARKLTGDHGYRVREV